MNMNVSNEPGMDYNILWKTSLQQASAMIYKASETSLEGFIFWRQQRFEQKAFLLKKCRRNYIWRRETIQLN